MKIYSLPVPSARGWSNGAAADRTPESRGPTQPITVASFPTTTVLSDDGASSSRKSGDPCANRWVLGLER